MSERRSAESEPLQTLVPTGDLHPVRAEADAALTRIRRSEEPETRETPQWAKALIGAELGHFELLDCIGEGGMGRVFRARDARLDRLVALKVLNPELAGDPDMRRRFEQEAKAAGRLDSPFFARVYHFGVDQGVCFIAMELVEGQTLRQAILESGALEPELVLKVGASLAYGLHHASQRGVIHRDVKPSNIVIDGDGNVKLIDMGLARDFLQVSGDATKTNVTMGTLDYISPEQASDPRHVDVRSDIYSLGCTLYHALTGQPPFPEGTDLQKLLSHQSEKPPNPRDVAPDAPEELADLVVAMMAKRPIDRPQSPAELIGRMQEAAASLQVEMPTSAPALPPPKAPSWRQHQLMWWGPALALLLAATIYAWIPGERDPDLNWDRRSTAANASQSETKDRPTKSEPPRRFGVGPVVVVPEGADLAKFVKEAPEGAVLQLAGDEYAVTATADADSARGLLVEKNLTLEPLSDRGRIRLGFHPTAAAVKDSLSLIQVRSAKLTLNRMWIEPGVRERGCVGIRVDQGELDLRDCLFDRGVDAMALPPAGTFALLVNGGKVAAIDTRFAAGDGVLKTSGEPASFYLWNSLIGPYRRAFVLDASKSEVQIKHSAVMAGGEAVFTLSNPTGVSLAVEHSVFVAPPSSAHAILIDSPKNNPMPATLWKGAGNLYAGGYSRQIVSNGRPLVEDVERMRGWGFLDDGAQRAAEWPWAATWEALSHPDDESENWRPLLALKDGVGGLTPDGLPVGVNPGSAPPVVAEEPDAKTRNNRATPQTDVVRNRNGGFLVEPSQSTNVSAGVFASLEEAVRRAPEGKSTTITISRGEAELRARLVKIVGKTIVLRTADRRTLRLAEPKDMEIGPSAMFDVGEGGKLALDGARFDVFAGRGDVGGAAFVRCSSGGVVEAVDSAVGVSQHQGAQAMVFFRPSSAGAQEGAAPPSLKIKRSDIRGAGSLVAADPRQPWSLDASESRIGVEGPLLKLGGASGRLGEPTANVAKLRQCVALLGTSLLLIEPTPDAFGDPSATAVQCEIDATVIVSVGAGNAPLLDVTAPPGLRSGVDWTNAVKWQGDWNLFAGFQSFLRLPEQDRTAGMTTTNMRTYAYADWLAYFRLSAGKQLQQSARAPAVRSVWDVTLPNGKAWLDQFGSIPAAFADEASLQGLP
jgi:serine/threonine protein kinase